MPTNERVEFEQQAHLAIEHFVAKYPEFSIDADQPAYRGGTNYVLFGQRGQQAVIFKQFGRPYRWAQEYFCLGHFSQTGYVPHILATVPEQLIVMVRLPGAAKT